MSGRPKTVLTAETLWDRKKKQQLAPEVTIHTQKPAYDPEKYIAKLGGNTLLITLTNDDIARLNRAFTEARISAVSRETLDEAREIARARGTGAANDFLRAKQVNTRSRTAFARSILSQELSRHSPDPVMEDELPSQQPLKQEKASIQRIAIGADPDTKGQRTLQQRTAHARQLLGMDETTAEDQPAPARRKPHNKELKFAKAFARASGMEVADVLNLPRRKMLPRKKATK